MNSYRVGCYFDRDDEVTVPVSKSTLANAVTQKKQQCDAAPKSAKDEYLIKICQFVKDTNEITRKVCFVKEDTKEKKTSGETTPTMFVCMDWFKDIIKELRDSGLTVEDCSNTVEMGYKISL